MERVWALPCLAWILNYLYPVFGEGRDDNSTISSNNTEASSKPLPELPYRRSEWEKSVLYNLLIVGLVVLFIVGAVFFIRYMRTEKKSAKRKYERLSKAEDDDDIELSIYEKK